MSRTKTMHSLHENSGHLRRFMLLQYSLWLDQHSMEEALRYIRTALEACEADARDEPGFDDVYPLMLQLCGKE